MYHLNDPEGAVGAVEQGLVAFGEHVLPSEGSQRQQTGHSLPKVAEDGGHEQRVQPLELPG